jgi:hypothetical protein
MPDYSVITARPRQCADAIYSRPTGENAEEPHRARLKRAQHGCQDTFTHLADIGQEIAASGIAAVKR